jgi:hypothetical protein
VPYVTCKLVPEERVTCVPQTTCTWEPYCVTRKVCRRVPVCVPVCEPACPPPCPPACPPSCSYKPGGAEWFARLHDRCRARKECRDDE